MLYSRNIFTLTKNHILSRHDIHGDFFGCDLNRWLTGLRGNKFLLRTLVIDLDTICHNRCHSNKDYGIADGEGLLDFALLVRLVRQQ